MVDTWNPAILNETTQAIDSWNPAEINQVTTKVDSWNPAILNNNLESTTPVVFSATITASFPEGATCTATDGTTTLTADDNPMAFIIPNEGTWAVSCVANGVTFSEDVVITSSGQTETVDITPVGDTYATTDSVPVLIACAGIGDSEITTIAGALADVETLTAILESENAVDYLVRSTIFASDVTSDSVAMTGIGAINYDADTLLNDSTWRAAICRSTYIENVLNVKVPTMTSATTPSGTVSADSYRSGNEPYKAFSGSSTWVSDHATNGGQSATGWIKYDFGYEYKFVFALLSKLQGVYPGGNVSTSVEYSTDDVTYNSAGTITGTYTDIIIAPVSARYIKINMTQKNTTTWGDFYPRLAGDPRYACQLYGRKDVV